MIELLLSASLLSSPSRAADCPWSARAADLVTKLEAAEAAYGELEVEKFTVALDEAALMLPCVGDPIEPALAARYHRDMGLRLFTDRQREKATQSFAAARAIEPDYTFPTTILPAGHAAHALYAMLDVSNPPRSRVPDAVAGYLLFDGAQGNERPTAWPSLVQVVDAGGKIAATAYTFPSDPMPAYEASPLPAADSGVAAARPLNPKPLFYAGSGAAAIASAVLYVFASKSAASFEEYHPDYSLDDLQAHRDKTNLLVYASLGSGALALGGAAAGWTVDSPD